MKSKLSLVFLLFLFTNLLYSQKQFPRYENIVKHFFSEYDIDESSNYVTLRFTKQKEGYYVEFYDRYSDLYINKQLYWNASSGNWQTLNLKKGIDNSSRSNDIKTELLNSSNADNFDINPYYGYIGWEKDVIAYYENSKNDLSEVEMYTLGRAYSDNASNLMNDNTGFADSSNLFTFKESGNNLLTQQQLETYRNYRHKAINTFGTLCRKNPEYPTIVGTICDKYYNEFSTSFLDLRIYQNEIEAEKEFKDSLFSNFYIEMAKNNLNSCDSNAILFTWGDNDTYPLLYVQSFMKYRQDVLIVNVSLLNNNNYINYFRQNKTLEADSVSMTMTKETYSGANQSYAEIKLSHFDSVYVPFSTIIELINQKNVITDNYAQPNCRDIYTNQITLGKNPKSNIKLILTDQYLLKGDLATFDIIESNMDKRPICFTISNFHGLEKYFQTNGFVYKLSNSQDIIDGYSISKGNNAHKVFNLVTNQFLFSTKGKISSKSENIVMRYYLDPFCILAKYYEYKGYRDSCRFVINSYLQQLPNERYAMDYATLPLIKSAYAIKMNIEANEMAKTVVDNMEISILKPLPDDVTKKRLLYTISELRKLIPHDNTTLLTRLSKLNLKLQ